MPPHIPIDTLYYASVVTRDARRVAHNFAEIYGIERWRVTNFSPSRLSNTTLRGRAPSGNLPGYTPTPGEYGFVSAIGSNANGGITFQLVQPTGGMSTFEEYLVTRGPGVHSVFMSVVERDDFAALRRWLAEQGIGLGQSFTFLDAADFYYFDTRKALGGYYLQVVVPHAASWEQALPTDDTWDFSGEVSRPTSVQAAAAVTGITHFGVVVPDLMDRLEHYARLFNQPVWRGMNWRTEHGSLEDTTNNGQPVKHGYFTGKAELGKNKLGLGFGFEVIQPTFGPSHYKEDFLQILGPGIHHVDFNIPMQDWTDWEAINNWLGEEHDAPTCMSGWLRGRSILFHYKDTRAKVGFVSEMHIADPSKPRGSSSAADYWFDFSGAEVRPGVSWSAR